MARKTTTTSSTSKDDEVPAKATPAKAPSKTGTPQKAAAKKSGTATAKAPVKKAASKAAAGPSKPAVHKEPATKAPPKSSAGAAAKTKSKSEREAFLAGQKELLLQERSSYMQSAEALKAQADSLALEHEPGDVQFDEEGGEGGTANVDREIDLHLSAQARATVHEIDLALAKIEDGTYGRCEQCGNPIPEPRLQALPHAALCVSCKSGGLSSRR